MTAAAEKEHFMNLYFNKILIYTIICAALFIPSAKVFAEGESGALNISFSEGKDRAGVLKTYSYNYPYGFKISRDGSLYLSNTPGDSILQFDFIGRLIKSYTSGKGLFTAAGDVTFDGDGMLYFASLKTMQIVKVDMLSNEMMRFGGYGTGEGELLSIYQIEAAAGKKIFAQDALAGKINAYSPTGAFIKKIDCNVPGFAISPKGQLLYFNYDRFTGYSLMLADVNEKTFTRVFTIGCCAVENAEFIGADYKGNVYLAVPLGNGAQYGDREIVVYNANGIYLSNYSVKRSQLTRQFFVFGDGSLYSAETDATAAFPVPTKMSIRKY
jgi:hypothetical protein